MDAGAAYGLTFTFAMLDVAIVVCSVSNSVVVIVIDNIIVSKLGLSMSVSMRATTLAGLVENV